MKLKFKRNDASMDAHASALLLLLLLEREFELKVGFVTVTIRCCGLGQCFQHGACRVAMATNAVVRFAVRQPTAKPFPQHWPCSPARARDGVHIAADAAALAITAGLLLRS
jgi:hypothetical protein